MAHRYLPVGASVVGGDWHDIVPLSGGRAALIVGDAMGHGPEAAAVMVQLRTAAHTLADLELPPEQVLRRLDKMAAGIAAAPFATCIYAVIDPPGGACEIAQAGHLPPVLVLPGGDGDDAGPAARAAARPRRGILPGHAGAACRREPPSRCTPTGWWRAAPGPWTTAWPRCAPRSARPWPGPARTLDEACDTVTQELRQHGEDDITLVLARIRR